jgi:hypothetical protein
LFSKTTETTFMASERDNREKTRSRRRSIVEAVFSHSSSVISPRFVFEAGKTRTELEIRARSPIQTGKPARSPQLIYVDDVKAEKEIPIASMALIAEQ